MILRSPLLSKGFYFPYLVTTLCLLKNVPTNPANRELPLKSAFRASGIRVGRGKLHRPEDLLTVPDPFSAPILGRLIQITVHPAYVVFHGGRGHRSSHLGGGLHTRMDAMSQRQAKSDSRFMSRFRALGELAIWTPAPSLTLIESQGSLLTLMLFTFLTCHDFKYGVGDLLWLCCTVYRHFVCVVALN